MDEVQLPALQGSNPLGFLAALGALDVIDRSGSITAPTLRWEGTLTPSAVISGLDDIEQLIDLVDADRSHWTDSIALNGPDPAAPSDDLKPSLPDVRRWYEATHDPADSRLLHALITEDAVAGDGRSKPTHLHFTAGRQQFLIMARQLRDEISRDDIVEALIGPWTYRSELPVFGWDNSRGERIHALRGFAPSGEKKTGVPGADWLALLGLRFFPVSTTARANLRTTRCAASWKSGSMSWPLWSPPLPASTIALLMTMPLDPTSPRHLAARGITGFYSAAIRRADQGGYGSFGPASAAPRG